MVDDGKDAGGARGWVPLAGLTLVAGGGAFVLVQLSGSPPRPCDGASMALLAEEGGDADAGPAPAAAYVALEPLAVALRPDAGARTLRIGLALGMRDADAVLTEADTLRLKDAILGTLRETDSAAITDPGEMPALREALLDQVRGVLGEGAVASLLITDFLMR